MGKADFLSDFPVKKVTKSIMCLYFMVSCFLRGFLYNDKNKRCEIKYPEEKMGYNEFDELGDKIQSIIDSAVNEKNYQKLSQSINQRIRLLIMGVMPSGMRLIILWAVVIPLAAAAVLMITERIGPDFSEGWKENRSTGEDHGTGYQGYADAKGNDSRNGNFQRNGTGRQDTNHQNSDLALYLPTNGIKVGEFEDSVCGILTGVFGIATMVVGGIELA